MTNAMLEICLQNLRFFAFHGLHEEEKIIGNDFEVSVSIHYHPQTPVIQELQETIDYGSVYALVKNEMSKPELLLETWVMQTANAILQNYALAESVRVCLKKMHPPIANFEGDVEVCYEVKRGDLPLNS